MLETRKLPSLLFLAAALCIPAVYWVGSWALAPGVTLDQAVLFLPHGDSDYIPQVKALSRLEFGESVVKERAGEGVRSFPMASVLLHSTLVRLFGDAGFPIAEVLEFLLCGWALAALLRSGGIPQRIAEVLALAVLSGAANFAVTALSRFAGPIPLTFWHARFPRPGVTEIFVLAFFLLAIRLVSRENPETNTRDWFLIAAVWACLLQADIYQAVNLAIAGSVLGAYLLKADFRRTLRGIGVAALTVAVLSVPFLYQRLHELAEVPRRWGMFTVPHRLYLVLPLRMVLLECVAILAGALVCWRAGRSRTTLVLTVLGVAAAASLIGGSVALLVLGKGIQMTHYRVSAEIFAGYVLLVCCGWALREVAEWVGAKFAGAQVRTTRWQAVAAAIAMLLCVGSARLSYAGSFGGDGWARDQSTMASHAGPSEEVRYQASFAEMRAALDAPQFRSAEVLGAFDRQLSNWWLYRGRYLYLPDLFNSTVPDAEAESRVLALLHLLGVTDGEFDGLLDNDFFVLRVLAGARYQACADYRPWPLSDYSPEARKRIARCSVIPTINIELPVSERRRLLDAYARFNPDAQPRRQLDVVVLSGGALRKFMHPETGGFRLAWRNETFEIWAPGGASARR